MLIQSNQSLHFCTKLARAIISEDYFSPTNMTDLPFAFVTPRMSIYLERLEAEKWFCTKKLQKSQEQQKTSRQSVRHWLEQTLSWI